MKDRKQYFFYISLLIFIVFFCNCYSRRQVRHREERSFTGYASYYAHKFHGRMTANGEVYDMYGMTAAHRTLPFDTVVEVTNLKNNKKVRVRINDRGPFIKGRHIDLSLGAAQKIDMVIDGVVPVRVEILSRAVTLPSQNKYVIQAGSFRDRATADDRLRHLESRGYNGYIEQFGDFFRVRIGPYENRRTAEQDQRRISRLGFDTFIAVCNR